MRLTSGSSIGPYEIDTLVGAGGMGEVYRAHDVRLGRAVAVKLLPELFARDAERLARFEREARTLAALNHPNIAQIYGLEEANGVRALVMELVEGPTLAEVIASGSGPGFEIPPASSGAHHAVPLPQVLAIARQIAAALDAAHEKGIVHRDLKPANIKLAPDGTVKVLDFGLAKLHAAEAPEGTGQSALANSPTLTSPVMTGAGTLLGTAAYMSPEQARGLPVDKRADIWAFGLILYEMLTGRQTFGGDTLTDTLAAVLRSEPDWTALPTDTPTWLRRLLRHCLDRDPRHRLRDIGDAIVEIDEARADQSPPAVTAVPSPPRRWWGYGGYLGVLTLVAIAGFAVGRRPQATAAAPMMLEVTLGNAALFTHLGSALAVSPNGTHLAYVTEGTDGRARALEIRPLHQLVARGLAEGSSPETSPYHPFFSPDGQWVGYVTTNELKKVPTAGGASHLLAPLARSRGATWLPDGTIVFAASVDTGLSRVSANGGTPEPLTQLDAAAGEASHRWPHAMPDGHTVLFVSYSRAFGNFADATIEAVDVRTRERKVLHRGGSEPRYLPTGHLIFVRDGVLFAASFDAGRVEVTGPPVPILQDVRWTREEGGAQLAISMTGILAFVAGPAPAPTYPAVSVDRDGKATPLVKESGTYANPRLSPDGRFLSLTVLNDANWDIWVYDLQREVFNRLTFHQAADTEQIWSPDGQFIAFSSGRDGREQLYRKRSDGSGDEEMMASANTDLYPMSWSADGTLLAMSSVFDVYSISIADRTIRPFLNASYQEVQPDFSPDGRWVAYASDESGRSEVYIRPFSSSSGRWQVSESGGNYPRWSRDGRELFYRVTEGVMAAGVDVAGTGLRVGRARLVVRGDYLGGLDGIGIGGLSFADYDVSADGRRFVMFPAADAQLQSERATVTLVTGWFDQVTRASGGSE